MVAMDEQSSPASRSGMDGVFASIRGFGLRRDTDDRWLAGVCSGIADRFGVDPLLVRGALIILLFVGGIGGLAYLIAWALLPDQHGRILAENALHGDAGGIVLLVVIGIALVSNAVNRWWLWLVLLPAALFVWWAVRSARMGKTPEQMSDEARAFGNRVASSLSQPTDHSVVADPPESGEASPSPLTTAAVAPTSAAAPSPAAPPHGMGPGRTGSVPTPVRVIPSSRRRGGLLALLLTAGLAVAGYGVGLLASSRLGWSGSSELIASGFAVGGAGLALALVGLTGRRAGFTAFLVACLAAITAAGTTIPDLPAGGFGERSWAAVSQPAGGFSLTAGEARLALAGAPAGTQVRTRMGAGQLTITVPPGTRATVTTHVRAGQVTVKQGGARQQYSGVDLRPDFTVTAGSGPNSVSVDAGIIAGEIIIQES
jgi:phage shock protein PspC (stress-responsive transcriptional regulator)